MALLLGQVLFQDFEIPSQITGLGGKQMLAKHVLIGGARVTDAMGPDDGDPSWSGRFRGSNARERARLLDAMRVSGKTLVLSFDVFLYLVVIEEFDFDFQQAYEIPYRIKLYITRAITTDVLPSLVDLVAGDLASLGGQISQFTASIPTS